MDYEAMGHEPMDHAAAHERIADLALEADGLDRLEASTAPEDRALQEHLRGCAACRLDVATSRRLSDGLRQALSDLPGASSVQPIVPPESLRAAILEAASREGASSRTSAEIAGPARAADTTRRAGVLARPRTWGASQWAFGIAAAVAIAILGGLAGMQLQRTSEGSGGDSIVAVVSTLDRVLAADQHRIVQLRTPDGTAAGAVAWSQRDFAVLATSLTPPPAGQVYRCWLQWSGKTAFIGAMEFAGDTAYWTGSVGDWAAVAFDPGTRFVVTLEPSAGAPPKAPTTPAVLQADLGT